jgi:hypothetical protein
MIKLLKLNEYKKVCIQMMQQESDIASHFKNESDEIIRDHQCGFRHNRSSNVQVFCICQVVEKKNFFLSLSLSLLRTHRLGEE